MNSVPLTWAVQSVAGLELLALAPQNVCVRPCAAAAAAASTHLAGRFQVVGVAASIGDRPSPSDSPILRSRSLPSGRSLAIPTLWNTSRITCRLRLPACIACPGHPCWQFRWRCVASNSAADELWDAQRSEKATGAISVGAQSHLETQGGIKSKETKQWPGSLHCTTCPRQREP